MAITPRLIATAYADTVYNFIKREEALVRRIYSDLLGIPTLGVGYALIIKAPAGSSRPYQLRGTLADDLSAIGITLSQTDITLLGTLLDNLNAGLGPSNIGTAPNQVASAIIESDLDGNPIEGTEESGSEHNFS